MSDQARWRTAAAEGVPGLASTTDTDGMRGATNVVFVRRFLACAVLLQSLFVLAISYYMWELADLFFFGFDRGTATLEQRLQVASPFAIVALWLAAATVAIWQVGEARSTPFAWLKHFSIAGLLPTNIVIVLFSWVPVPFTPDLVFVLVGLSMGAVGAAYVVLALMVFAGPLRDRPRAEAPPT